MKKLIYFFAILSLAALIFSCGSDDDDNNPTGNGDGSNPPVINSISSSTLKHGDQLIINGNFFGLQQGSSTIDFAGTPATQVSSWNNTRITVIVPTGAVSGKLSVTVNNKKSNEIDYLIEEVVDPNAPVINTVSSLNIRPGDRIQINGLRFGSNKGLSVVDFGGVSAVEYPRWRDNEIQVTVPVNIQAGDITVKVNDLTSNRVAYTVRSDQNADLVIDGINPSIGIVGSTIEIYGSGFGFSRGNSVVNFNGRNSNGVNATNYTRWTDQSILVEVPDSAITGDVKIIKDGEESNSVQFTVNESYELLDMVVIPEGTYMMGSDESDNDFIGFRPKHQVTISNSFYMTKTEITQAEYKEVMNGSNPSRFKDDTYPVQNVSWIKAVEFCNRLSELEGLEPCYIITGLSASCDFNANGYRLPTEAEWEYACKAGQDVAFAGTGDVEDMGWSRMDGTDNPQPVGEKQPNAFGLYDMHGNAAEWVWDYFEYEYYASSPGVDPKGPDSGIDRVFRGGSYQDDPVYLQSFYRQSAGPDQTQFYIGFRVVKNF